MQGAGVYGPRPGRKFRKPYKESSFRSSGAGGYIVELLWMKITLIGKTVCVRMCMFVSAVLFPERNEEPISGLQES